MEHLATGTTRIKDCCCCWNLIFQTTNLALCSMLSKRLYFLVGPGNPDCWKTISFAKLCAFFDLYFFLFLFSPKTKNPMTFSRNLSTKFVILSPKYVLIFFYNNSFVKCYDSLLQLNRMAFKWLWLLLGSKLLKPNRNLLTPNYVK